VPSFKVSTCTKWPFNSRNIRYHVQKGCVYNVEPARPAVIVSTVNSVTEAHGYEYPIFTMHSLQHLSLELRSREGAAHVRHPQR
jgi:hypothetical protein